MSSSLQSAGGHVATSTPATTAQPAPSTPPGGGVARPNATAHALDLMQAASAARRLHAVAVAAADCTSDFLDHDALCRASELLAVADRLALELAEQLDGAYLCAVSGEMRGWAQ